MASKSIKEYLEEIKKDKEEKRVKVQAKLDNYTAELDTLEKKTVSLLDEMFDFDTITLDRVREIGVELKQISHERVRLAMLIYGWENKLNQLKFI